MKTVILSRVAHSEWVKLTTVRSTLMAYAAITAASVLLAGVVFVLPNANAGGGAGDQLLLLLILVELLVGSTGVVAMTSEYSAQTIRSTITAVPRRIPVLLAKVLVHSGTVLFVFVLATAAGRAGASAFAPDAVASLTDPVVLRGLGGSALVFIVTCALGVALGVLNRSAPAALAGLFCLMFLPVLVTVAPDVTAYLPGRLAQAVVLADNPPEARLLDGPTAAGTLLVWALLAVGAAAFALGRRDA